MSNANHSAVKRILVLVQSRTGLELTPYIGTIIDAWNENPFGFKFNANKQAELQAWLERSLRWGRDTDAGALAQRGFASFREINPKDSLHLRLSSDPAKRPSGIHLDSVSCVASRRADGSVAYSGKLMEHIACDLMHWPPQGPLSNEMF